MRYTTLLFDLDHTLLDSDASEVDAYAHTMDTIGLADPDVHFDRYVSINQTMWRAVERGELEPGDLRHQRFQAFTEQLLIDADPFAMADAFVWGLGAHGALYEGAREVLEQLSAVATLAMITNGLSEVQRARIDRLDLAGYFDAIVISSEVGATKPRPEIFEHAFELLGQPPKSTTLMIGDSLTSDIRGGTDFGIDTCWFNPHGRTAGPHDRVTHEIRRLDQLVPLATG
ncbi:MAG: YjjG family noncanonical pyrimidine nucleotidase [Ilumatobacteraceae bacterium]